MDRPRIDCPTHGDQPAYVTRNKSAYCPMCLIQGHAEHIKASTGVEGLPRIVHPPEDYQRGHGLMPLIEKMHQILHPHGNPDHEWDSDTTEALSSLVYTVIPRPEDDCGLMYTLGPHIRILRECLDELHDGNSDRGLANLGQAISDLEEDVQDYDAQHLVLHCPATEVDSMRDYLTRRTCRTLKFQDGACLDNDAERESVAESIADMLLELAK